MRTIVHLSDLHFGRVDERLLDPLRRQVEELAPHLVVVSGDLTQRAKPAEFRAARAFLDSLAGPQVVVPGNHDVPYYNVFQRFFQPLDKYRRFIAEDVEPYYVDAEIAVVGVNTARSLVFKGGRINREQVDRARARLCDLPVGVTKIIVTHHPFDVPEASTEAHQIVGRAQMAIPLLAECGADLLLSGHLHDTHTGHTRDRYRIEGFNALVVQAGTATSNRRREQPNSFNALRIEARRVAIDRYHWDESAGHFAFNGTERFQHTAEGWAPALG